MGNDEDDTEIGEVQVMLPFAQRFVAYGAKSLQAAVMELIENTQIAHKLEMDLCRIKDFVYPDGWIHVEYANETGEVDVDFSNECESG